MCYTGRCPYECSSWGAPNAGECMLKSYETPPEDAECVLAERWYEEQRRKHPIRTLIEDCRFKWLNLKLRLSGQDEVPF